jgi:predicted aspartyl protease
MIRICAGVLALALASAANAGCKIVQLAEWPVSHANNRPLVEGKINGQPVKVLIDTGANATFVWRWTADALGLPLSGAEGVRIFGAGGEAQIAATMVKALEIGAYRANSTRLVVMGSDHEKPQESGLVLGDEFFSSFSTEFDIAHGFVRLLRPEGCKADQLAYWSNTYSLAELQPTRVENPHIMLTVMVNGKHVNAILDTGAPTSMLDASVAERIGIKPGATAETATVRGLGPQSFPTWVGTFDSVAIGDETIRNVRLRVGDMFGKDKIVSTGSRIGRSTWTDSTEMLLGFDFLLSHRVLVLPKEHAVVFTYNGGPLFQYVAPPTEQAVESEKSP